MSFVSRSFARLELGPRSTDDMVTAITLTTIWMISTRRRLQSTVPLFHDLNAAELIDFWADDHIIPVPGSSSNRAEQESHDHIPSPLHRHVA